MVLTDIHDDNTCGDDDDAFHGACDCTVMPGWMLVLLLLLLLLFDGDVHAISLTAAAAISKSYNS